MIPSEPTVPTERRSSLHVSSLQTTDSGTYFCAVQRSAPQAPAACTHTLPGAQPLLQPQSHHDAVTRYLHCLVFLTYTGTVLTTKTFQPNEFGIWSFPFRISSIFPSALEPLTCS